MLTKKIFWLFGAALLLVTPVLLPLLAQEQIPTEEEEIVLESETKAVEAPALASPLSDIAVERITTLIRQLDTRLNITIDRFTSISNRLHTRIEEAERDGRDMSNAINALVTADNAINNSKTLLQQSRLNAEAMMSSDDPAFHWQRLKTNYSEIGKALTATLSALRVTIYNLQEN